jgi:hypothetical protein
MFGVREARTLDLRITQLSYETYALANCATTPIVNIGLGRSKLNAALVPSRYTEYSLD